MARTGLTAVALLAAGLAARADGEVITRVGAGGDLQRAISAARPGDTIELQAGATYTGNFVLPDTGASSDYITIRTAGEPGSLPSAGVRVGPGVSGRLAIVRSPNGAPALRTAPAAHHWRLELLEFRANSRGYGEIISLGSGGSDQATLAVVPHHLALDRLLVRGDPVIGQKRGIGLNSASTAITNSYISDCKGIGFDSQAVAGWNGPGPYTIANNYLEGAGENFLLGGASPPIPNLIPADITFTRNDVVKPLAWKEPILRTPAGVSASAGPGGALPAGTYYYFVVAALPTAEDSWAWSGRSTAAAATVGDGGAVTLRWTGDPAASVYRVYRGTAPGAADRFFDSISTTFTDTGAVAPTGEDRGEWITPSVWSVKNLFELKAAERVLVNGNLFENVWRESQSGYAVLFTPRNQDNTSPWVAVRDVTFSNNIVRRAGAGVQVLGYDDAAPASSQRTQRIRIVNNVFADIGTSQCPGAGHWLLINGGPSEVRAEHNTVLQGGNMVYAAGGSPGAETVSPNFVFANNLAPHGPYGVMGDNHGVGNDTIAAYFPGADMRGNGIACVAGSSGCGPANYPAGNAFLSEAEWQGLFVNPSAGDYRLRAGSVTVKAGTDGRPAGADMDAIEAARAGSTLASIPSPAKPANVRVM